MTVQTGANPTAPVMLNDRVFLPLGYKGILAFDL
jgi:hypothetical protein